MSWGLSPYLPLLIVAVVVERIDSFRPTMLSGLEVIGFLGMMTRVAKPSYRDGIYRGNERLSGFKFPSDDSTKLATLSYFWKSTHCQKKYQELRSLPV